MNNISQLNVMFADSFIQVVMQMAIQYAINTIIGIYNNCRK